MFPLLQRVDLRVPYAVLTLLWAYLLDLLPLPGVYFPVANWKAGLTALVHSGFYAVMGGWHFVESFVAPPENLPDLWVVANVGVGAAGFVLCYLWCFYRLVVESGVFSSGEKRKTE